MRFIHLSDLHLGIRLRDYSLRDDQEYILDQIIEATKAEQPDAVLIAGDVFDKADPGPDAVALFSDFVAELKAAVPGAAVMIISGNHDNGERINLYRDVLRIAGVHVAGRFPEGAPEKVTLEDEEGPVHFHLLPFVRPGAARQIREEDEPLSYQDAVRQLIGQTGATPQERHVLISHQFYIPAGQQAEDVERTDSEMPRRGNVDAVPSDVLKDFRYAALGHIHKPMKVAENAYYCGTPLAYSLSERDQEKSILAVDLPAAGPAQIRKLPLRPRHAVRRLEGTLEEVAAQPSGDYVEVILTGEKNTNASTVVSRLRKAFPRLLGYAHADDAAAAASEPAIIVRREIDPLKLCLEFLGEDADEDNQHILEDVLRELEVSE